MRRRDTILEAMVAFRALSPRVALSEIVAFLYICENEGLSVQELAYVAGMSQSAASRSARGLGRAGSGWARPPALGLVDPFQRPSDGRSHILKLSREGERLRAQLDEIIARATPIRPDRAENDNG